MALRAVEHNFTGAARKYTETYDSTKTILGDLIGQYTGSTSTDKFAGPLRFGRDSSAQIYGVARPNETATAIPGIYPHVVRWCNKTGYYTTGTVSASGTAVTGNTTSWLSGGVPVGARIGFGSTDPDQITTWYNIASINSATSITLESSAGTVAGGTSYVINKNRQIDWVFLGDNATATTNRRLTFYEFDRLTSIFTWKGFIITTHPSGTNATIKGLRAVYDTYTTGTVTVAMTSSYSTGTVSVAGTAVTGSTTVWVAGHQGMKIGFGSTNPTSITTWYRVVTVSSNTAIVIDTGAGTIAGGTAYVIATCNVTGSGTTWSADRIFVGSRIGFGSTDPTQIATWYYINAVSSDTALIIQDTDTAAGTGGTTPALTVGSSAAYVIEDLRFLMAQTNNTAASGGLFMIGGVSYASFSTNGQTIPTGASTDKVKASYWLADASTVTNVTAAGCAIESRVNWTTQYAYVLDTTGSVYKYNFRKALTLTTGKDTATLVLKTGVQAPALTGTMSSTNNGRIGTLTHQGGTLSLYFATTTRIYRIPLTNITSGSTSWASAPADSMQEVPTGGSGTYTASATMTAVEIADATDRLIVTCTGAATAPGINRAYYTQYNTVSNPMDHTFLMDSRQQDQSTADNDSAPHPSPQGAVLSVWSEGGLVYLSRAGTASTTNLLYALPLGADWTYASGTVKQRLITPSLSTPNCAKFDSVLVKSANYMGGGNLQIPTEPYRLYYRTSGITDDSGSWTLVDQTGDLSAITEASSIQFMFEFRMLGTFCLPARIYGLTVTYQDNTTDSHYQPSVAQSSTSSKRFAWRFSTAFGGTVPTLYIRLYDAVSGSVLVEDDSATPAGTWEKSTDGGSNWTSYNDTDKSNDTTYIRYTPASLGDNIKVRALLSQQPI